MWCAYPPIIWTQRIVLSWRRKIKIPQSSVSELGCNHSLVGTHFSALNSSSDDISLDSLGHSCLDGSEAGLPWCNCSFHSSCVIAWSPCWTICGCVLELLSLRFIVPRVLVPVVLFLGIRSLSDALAHCNFVCPMCENLQVLPKQRGAEWRQRLSF